MDFFASVEFALALIGVSTVALTGAAVALSRRGGSPDDPAVLEPAPTDDVLAEPRTPRADSGEDRAGSTDHAPAATLAPGELAGPDATITEPARDVPAPAAGRLERLRARLARSNSAIGRALLDLLAGDSVSSETWDDIEDLLLAADLGLEPATELLDRLQEYVKVTGRATQDELKDVLVAELTALLDPAMDRSIVSDRQGDRPAVVMLVGVNGAGKTTTVGKFARVLVAQDKDVVLGAADTFRAAAADQLQTWGSRIGVPTIRSQRDGADPAAVAFDAVSHGVAEEVDVVVIDTAGRLQNKQGLMDELNKVKRVAEKPLGGAQIDEILLVIDATTGQNGLSQAKVFAEAVGVTGVVLTKLDGTAKGGIVVAVQRALGVPVKLVGLGEGPDDLAPFDAETFAAALVN